MNINKAIPVRNCEFFENNELVTVLYKKEKLTIFEKLFLKKQSLKPYKIDLDEMGSFIWNKCDGITTVEEITVKAQNHFKDKIKHAEERIEKFLTQMQRNKLITLYLKQDKSNKM